MEALATATIEEAAERTALDKNFREFMADPTEANKVVFAESLSLALVQVAAYPNGYITIEDCPTLAGATKVDVLTVEAPVDGVAKFTYSVNGGDTLNGELTDFLGCIFSI